MYSFDLYLSVGDGVVYPLRENSSPERVDLLNERGKWVDESDDEGEREGGTYFETIDETEHENRAIVQTPDVVTFK